MFSVSDEVLEGEVKVPLSKPDHNKANPRIGVGAMYFRADSKFFFTRNGELTELSFLDSSIIRILRIRIKARRNLLWDILRLPSSRRAALGLYVILTL